VNLVKVPKLSADGGENIKHSPFKAIIRSPSNQSSTNSMKVIVNK